MGVQNKIVWQRNTEIQVLQKLRERQRQRQRDRESERERAAAADWFHPERDYAVDIGRVGDDR